MQRILKYETTAANTGIPQMAEKVMVQDKDKPLLRDNLHTIWKTPKIRLGNEYRRLALKPRTENYAREVNARNAVMRVHDGLETKKYILARSKRYPVFMLGMKTEIYYDRPSLADLLGMRKNRRVKNLIRKSGLTMEKMHKMALEAYDELAKNVASIESEREAELDFAPNQFLVDSLDGRGRLKLIMVDM
jgi:hypothetical protein